MRVICLLVGIHFISPSWADEAEPGSYIVVRGAIAQCPNWTGRILNIEQVDGEGVVAFLQLPPLEAAGLDAGEIQKKVLDTIEEQTGHRPVTISVEILANEAEYRLLLNQYIHSLQSMVHDRCPPDCSPGMTGWPACKEEWKTRPQQNDREDSIEKLRRLKLAESVV